MSCDWPVVKTGDIFELINGYAFKSRDFTADGAAVLKIKNIKAGKLNLDNLAFVDTSFLSEKPDKIVLRDDLLITMSGNRHDGSMETWVGKVCWFGLRTNYLINQRVGILRLKKNINANPRFLAYQLSSTEFQHHFIAVATSSGGQANLSPTQIKSTELFLPPRQTQDRVAKILGELEDKIKVSEQINQTLEQIAQAIFKSWFVDFDPVKAKINALAAGGSEEDALLAAMQAISGKDKAQLTQLQTENPENYNQLRTTAELFPSAMQDSELGEIPEGWFLEPFSNIARLDTTSVKPAKESEKIWEHYSIPAFDDGMSPAFDLGVDIKSNKYRVFPASILVSKLNPHFPRTWLPDVFDSNAAICSTEFMQFVPIKPNQRAFVAGVVKSESFQNGIMMRVTGSTGSRQRAQPKQVAEMEVLLPSEELRSIYSVLIAPQLESQASNIREALNLADVRDTLLPKLLSGELQVNSTDRVHTKLPNDKNEHDLNALISEIEKELPPKSHFVVHESSRKQRHKLGMIGYSTTITGDLGQGGAEYFKLPAFLSELRSNKILQGVFSTVVDSATGIPFLMVVITAVLNKFLGEKVKLDQRTAIVLLSFPENRTCKVSKLLNESNRLSLNAGLSPFDEDELSGTLKRLKVHGLVTHQDRTFTEWALVEKFDHKGARRP